MLSVTILILGLLLPQVGITPPQNPGLAAKIRAMVKADQQLRMEAIELLKQGKMTKEKADKLSDIDRHNTNQMKQIVKTYGWPTFTLVGRQAAGDAWLLVQHADLDPKFQRLCLDLMGPLLDQGEVSKANYAYLTDRVLSAEGKKQIYGTQFVQGKDGRWNPKPVEDPENVDRRRAEMGMPSLAEYKKMLEEMYGTRPPN